MKSLFFAIAVAAIALYVPGFFLLRSIRFSRLMAITCAPIVAFFFYVMLPVVYGFFGVYCSPITVGLIPLAICLGCYGAARALRRKPIAVFDFACCERVRVGSRSMSFEWLALGLYVAIGAFVCWFMFISQLASADAFVAQWDNQLHLNAVRAFLDTGQWSSLHVSVYAASPDYAIPYTASAGWYPAAWHDAVALVCAMSGESITACANALNSVLAGITYPSAMFLLVKTLFPDDRLVVIAGAAVASAFTAIPWGMFVKGPLYPNFTAFVVMVLFMAVLISFADQKHVRQMLVPFVVFSVISFVVLVFAHPNALFTAFVFLAAYASHVVFVSVRSSERFSHQARTTIAVFSSMAVLLAAGLFLVACFNAPFLQGVVQHGFRSTLSLPSAIKSTMLLNLKGAIHVRSAPEYVLAVITGCGVVYCALKRKFWLLLPATYMAVGLVLAKSTDVELAKLITGYWYSSPIRLAACFELFLVPIAACGLAGLARTPSWIAERVSGGLSSRSKGLSASKTVIVAVAVIALFAPSLHLPGGSTLKSGIWEQRELMQSCYAIDDEAIYSMSERDFVKKALEVIPEGSLVLNQPRDGTVFAYALDGLNTYYRTISYQGRTDASKLIRSKLYDFARNSAVRDAVASTGAQYLLKLDSGTSDTTGSWMTPTAESSWAGIIKVTDGTPGFTVVLEQGDMRLYRIG